MLVGVVALTLVTTSIALAGPVGTAQGFEDDDGNLIDNAGAGIDWNSFDPISWLPANSATPTRQADKSALGFLFKGLEDWQATNSDSAFAGGTKQDDNCASVITAKAPNKDDLKRIYIASTVVGTSTFLNLAWVRIPQNTTSASAHVAFEFNKGTTTCGAGSPLVQRTAGDMLIVYDFEGGGGDPVLTLRRWVTSGACEISSNSAPCWGTATNLTAGGFAEAKVNVGSAVLDALAPPALGSSTSVDATLQDSEFGEAGINLTAAGVFPPGVCESFGKVSGISRSSGNSGTAQMKDLVGPGNFSLTNCGTVTIIKNTVPADVNQNFNFTSNLAGAQLSCTADTSPASFILNDVGAGNNASNTEVCSNVPAGSYIVTEGADPAGFEFDDVTCTASTGSSGTQDATVEKEVDIVIVGGGSVTCTYVNNQQLGAIKVTKTSSKTDNPLAGATFSVTGPNSFSATLTTGADGTDCIDGLTFGSYTVTETGAPTGFIIDDTTGHTVAVNTNADCDDDPYGGEIDQLHRHPHSGYSGPLPRRWLG